LNPRANAERSKILAEIDLIVRDLEQVANEIQTQRGIGAEDCSSSLRSTAAKYRRLKAKLAGLQ